MPIGRRLLLTALLVLAGPACTRGAGASPSGAGPTVADPPRATTPALPVVAEIEAAYLRSWAVYAAAVGRVDPGHLPTAFADSALTLKRREVAGLRRSGHALRVRVGHDPEIVLIDAVTAVVTDRLRNHTVLVDARTRRPLEPDPRQILTRAYTLRRDGGPWKVTEAVALG